jgi:hypothetical protein
MCWSKKKLKIFLMTFYNQISIFFILLCVLHVPLVTFCETNKPFTLLKTVTATFLGRCFRLMNGVSEHLKWWDFFAYVSLPKPLNEFQFKFDVRDFTTASVV